MQRISRSNVLLAVLTILCVTTSFSAQAAKGQQNQKRGEPGVFDDYALSLSWAPSYCASHPTDPNECGPNKRFGFVLHGLWPQYEKSWPQFCSNATMTPKEEDQYAPLYPSKALMEHEWPKHGTCSGLGVDGYFTLSKTLKESVRIPDAYQQPATTFKTTSQELAKAFLTANPDLKEGSVLAVCSGKFLSEIHVCFDKAGTQSRACSDSETKRANKSCHDAFLVQNVK